MLPIVISKDSKAAWNLFLLPVLLCVFCNRFEILCHLWHCALLLWFTISALVVPIVV